MPEPTHPALAPLVALLRMAEYRDALSTGRDFNGRPFASGIPQADLRAAIAEASALLGEVRDTDRLVLVPGSPEVAEGLRALLERLNEGERP